MVVGRLFGKGSPILCTILRSMTHHAVSHSELPLPSTATPTLNNIDHDPHENHNPSHSPPTTTSPETYVATNGPSPKQRFRVRTTDRGTKLEGSHSDNEASFSRTLRRRELKGIAKPEHGHGACTSNLDLLTMDGALQRIQRLNSLKPLSGTTNGGLKAVPGSLKKIGGSHAVVTENHCKVNSDLDMDVPWGMAKATAFSQDDSHVLRSRTASSHRVRPYIVNHKAVDKSS